MSTNCASDRQITFNVAANRSYEEVCVLAIGDSYELSCHNYAGIGWPGNFLIIESKAYCQNFQEGFKKTTTLKIEGN